MMDIFYAVALGKSQRVSEKNFRNKTCDENCSRGL